MSDLITVERAAGALGAYLTGIDLAAPAISDEVMQDLVTLAVEHEVVFIRDQHIDASVFQRTAERFGEILDHPAYARAAGADGVQVLESTPEVPSKIELWHSDMTFAPEPPSFTLLHAQIVPAVGGDTLWASATAAYTKLSQPLQDLLADLSAEHDFRHGFAESLAEPGGPERLAQAIADNPPVSHPVVRTHPVSGKQSIYVNPLFTTRINALSKAESDHLLTFLYRHVVTEEFTVRLSWQPGTIAIWDNRAVQHRPVNDYFGQHRRLHRVTIRGDRPF